MATISKVGFKSPRAAAASGIIFAVLFLTSLALLVSAMPASPGDTGEWLATGRSRVSLALNLTPYSGVAFLWFIGVLRDRLGDAEDRLFASVFLGSGVIFMVLVFVAGAALGAVLATSAGASADFAQTQTFRWARAFSYALVSIVALKMAAVFLMTASTLILRTHVTARWTAIVGYVMAACILIGSHFFDWTLVVLPVWVLCVSISILNDEFRHPERPATEPVGQTASLT
jgi:hypothetical protein